MAPMTETVSEIPVPADSLLARYGDEADYRDCFVREVAGELTLEQFMTRFYTSSAFLPERLVLKALGKPASSADARALASGTSDTFGVWKVVERQDGDGGSQVLLASKPTGTASWFSVEPLENATRLYFGSWVGTINESGWMALKDAHVWYSRVLLGGV